VLETGIHGGAWLGLGIGALFLVFGTFGFPEQGQMLDQSKKSDIIKRQAIPVIRKDVKIVMSF